MKRKARELSNVIRWAESSKKKKEKKRRRNQNTNKKKKQSSEITLAHKFTTLRPFPAFLLTILLRCDTDIETL
jgi:hypothetical protein